MSATYGVASNQDSKKNAKLDVVKVKRYWPGKAPEFGAEEYGEEDSDVLQVGKQKERVVEPEHRAEDSEEEYRRRRVHEKRMQEHSSDEDAGQSAVVAKVIKKNPTAIILHKNDRSEQDELQRQERQQRQQEEAQNESEEDEEEAQRRRQRIRENYLKRREAEDKAKSEVDQVAQTLTPAQVAVKLVSGNRRRQTESEDMDIDTHQGKDRSEIADEDDKTERVKEEDEEGDVEDSDEWETDTDEEENQEGLLKPVFINKSNRDTIAEKEKILKEQEEEMKKREERLEQRKIESQKMVIEEVRKEEQQSKEKDDSEDERFKMPDTDDEQDAQEQYEAWKIRELTRIKKEKEIRDEEAKTKAEIERRRNLTDEQRRREDMEDEKAVKHLKQDKKKWNYLQRYYHKGAFFQEKDKHGVVITDGIYNRDYSEPTLEDRFDKSILPKVMQVKNFGRAGRTKYTHLLDQDTSQHSAITNPITRQPLPTAESRPLFGAPSSEGRFSHRTPGIGDMDKPSYKKRRKN